MSDKPKFTPIIGEYSRTYHFRDGGKLKLENVTGLCVRPTSHRLELADGRKFIIPGHQFVAIEIDADEWSA